MEQTPNKRRSLKDDLEELRKMRRSSQERQGKDPMKEAGNEARSKAMKMNSGSSTFQTGGFSARTKVDGSAMRDKPLSKANLESYREAQKEQVKPKSPTPRKRSGAGREDALNRYMEERKRKQMGQSRVVG